MYEYLKTTKSDFVNKHISKREDRITFTFDFELLEAEIENIKKCITSIGNKVFTRIQQISIDLLKNYVNTLNYQEVETRTAAVIKNRNNASVTRNY